MITVVPVPHVHQIVLHAHLPLHAPHAQVSTIFQVELVQVALKIVSLVLVLPFVPFAVLDSH
jgi:hypothetical protein